MNSSLQSMIRGDRTPRLGGALRRPSLALVALAAVVAGCGASAPPAPPRAALRLVLDTPGDLDVVRGRSVEVSGGVPPAAARVLLRGEAVAGRGGGLPTP